MTRDIGGWLESLDLSKYAGVFAEAEVDFAILPQLDDNDLRELGIPLGPRKNLLAAIAGLDARDSEPPSANPASREAERRQLTVMFCDLVGSTALSGQLDPEDYREVMQAYQDTCAAVVGRYEGFVSKHLGDGVLVYFGYPQAHEDDAARAIHAGLEIVNGLHELNRTLTKRHNIALGVRVGIHTGLVIAGDMRGAESQEADAVIGEVPNIAARLQELATSNSVLISESTRRLAEGLFIVEGLGEQNIRGVSRNRRKRRTVVLCGSRRTRLNRAGRPRRRDRSAG